jgi:hypothetical protein
VWHVTEHNRLFVVEATAGIAITCPSLKIEDLDN